MYDKSCDRNLSINSSTSSNQFNKGLNNKIENLTLQFDSFNDLKSKLKIKCEKFICQFHNNDICYKHIIKNKFYCKECQVTKEYVVN